MLSVMKVDNLRASISSLSPRHQTQLLEKLSFPETLRFYLGDLEKNVSRNEKNKEDPFFLQVCKKKSESH